MPAVETGAGEGAPGRGIGDARPRQALDLLKGVEAVDELRAEDRGAADRVVERGEGRDEPRHGRAARSWPEGRQEEARGEAPRGAGEAGPRNRSDRHAVHDRSRRVEA